MVLDVVIWVDWISEVGILVVWPILATSSVVHLVVRTSWKLALRSRLLNDTTAMIRASTTWYRSRWNEILSHWLTAIFEAITIILTGANWVTSSRRSLSMCVILVHSMINEFILFIWWCFLKWLSLLIIHLTIVISRHDWTLLIKMLVRIHWWRPIHAVPKVIMMLLKVMNFLISWIGGANCLFSASNVISYSFILWLYRRWTLILITQ